MKTLFEFLKLMLSLVFGVILACVYLLVFSPLLILGYLFSGNKFEDVLGEWIDKTQYMFDFEQT